MGTEQADSTLPLVLGTVQLGLEYGVANKTGRPAISQAIAIVAAAWEEGVRCFDTAQAYGESEKILGTAFKELKIGQDAKVVSKLSPDLHSQEDEIISKSVRSSLKNLGVPRFEGLLVHNPAGAESWHGGLGASLAEIQRAGLTTRIGASVYSVEEGKQCLAMSGISLLQLPFNVFDQDAYQKDFFFAAQKGGCLLHVRSVFLQGLLLMEPEEFPSFLRNAVPWARRFADLCRKVGLSKRKVALAYAYWRAKPFPLVIGAETPAQILENCRDMKAVVAFSEEDLEQLACLVDNVLWVQDKGIVNPSLWGAQQ
ncbi:MAG: aldo/keto reductase [Desulfurivibrionaceae bacterium]|jgi:aryl-alcohol dehydrogenase-like predicted oxidoreductase